jgi:hypothetical protein
VDVKKIIIAIAFLTLLYDNVSFSQEQSIPPAKIYLGLSLGCSLLHIGFSYLFYDYGAQVIYALDNQYLMLSYSRINAFNLKIFRGQKDDDSKMDRLELCYGRAICLKEDDKLFRDIFVGAMIGVAYNSIRYYSNDLAFDQGNTTNIHKLELPIGVTISNSLSKQTNIVFEMKYHILDGGMSYPDFKFFISFNIL